MVNRCICHKTTFRDILDQVKDGKPLEQVVVETSAGKGCGMCQPYIKLTIKTGETSLDPGAPTVYRDLLKEFDKENGDPWL